MAARVDRILSAALGGDAHVTLNVKAAELLAEAESVADTISEVLGGAGPGVEPSGGCRRR